MSKQGSLDQQQACGAVINDIVHFPVILWRKGRTTSKSRKNKRLFFCCQMELLVPMLNASSVGDFCKYLGFSYCNQSEVVQLHKTGAAIFSVCKALFACFLEPLPLEWQHNIFLENYLQ